MKPMYVLFAVAASLLLFGCFGTGGGEATPTPVPPTATPVATPTPEISPLGGDRDEHGCIPSAGYTWCEELQKCIRPWEETCAAPTPTPTPAVTPSGTPMGAGAANVEIVGSAFLPTTITVPVGTTVTWRNMDTTRTVTSDTGVFDSGVLPQQQSWSYTFDTPGTYPYHCTYDPSVQGTVVVTS